MDWETRLSETSLQAKASDIRELLKFTSRPDMISFAGGLPDPSLFPVEDYRVALNVVMDNYGPSALQYGPTEGLTELRQELVRQLDLEGITCPAGIENIILTTGSQQALDLIARVLINPGDTILVEAPSYLGALQAFNLRQPRYEAVEMDGHGLIVERLEEKLAQLKREGRKPKFLYTIPTFQNPAGVTLSLERRKALIEISQREDLLIIEDDPYGRLRFRDTAPPSLQSLAGSGLVVSLRTFSKTLSPGLRTGYVVGDPGLLRRIVILKQATDLCSPALAHYTVLEMMRSGAMERYIKKVVEVYGHKERVMEAALQTHLGESPVLWNEPAGGMFFWVELPAGADTGVMLAEALQSGVAYVKGAAFYTDGRQGRNCLRLNFSMPSPSQIEDGISRLAGIIQKSLVKSRV